MTSFRVGADIGGTFTDLVLLEPDGTLHTKKVLSTPPDYSRAIAEGTVELLASAGYSGDRIGEFAHGTTIATNAIIERKGCRVALVTTEGFRDVLEIGRFRSPRLYDIHFRKPEPLVPRRLRFEVRERIAADGSVVEPLDRDGLDAIARTIAANNVEAVAICFLNSYVNPQHELAAQRVLQEALGDVSVSTSVQLLPQIQEFERTSTTVVNAYIRPVVERYVRSLSARLREIGVHVPLLIMQSSGGVLPARLAGENPVYIIESGPAAGVVGAQRLGKHLGLGDLMVLDMGGTTAKASIIQDGEFTIMPESEVGDANVGHRLIQGAGYAVQVPTIDIAEVGAGGGSIAQVDIAGGIRVGPHSAGAVPGPICYGRGGEEPTVTDANLILGYLNPGQLVGGELALDYRNAQAALEALAHRLGRPLVDTAYGIHLIANANMMRALSGVSSERGKDPASFTLLAIGGNGGVHCGNLAESLRIRRILVPPVAGLFSALGLLLSDIEHQVIRGFYCVLEDTNAADFNETLAPMIQEARALLAADGFRGEDQQQLEIVIELKYVGQTWSMRVPLAGYPVDDAILGDLRERFDRLHEETYGYRSSQERLQLVAIKIVARGLADTPRVPETLTRAHERIAARGERDAYFGEDAGWLTTPVMPRGDLGTDAREGPLIIEDYDATVVVRPGWRAHRDGWNNIVVERA